jgi:recombination protein RecA
MTDMTPYAATGIKLFNDDLISDANYVYPFDCAPLDILLGGGIYSGKIIEIYGPNSHGKSTLALEITKAFANYWNAQNNDKYGVLWVEAESALDKMRAAYMECPVDKFLVCEPPHLESCQQMVESTLDKAVKNKMPLIAVIDTIAALQTEAEAQPMIDPKTGKPNLFGNGMMEKPRKVWKMLRDLTPKLAAADTTLILVNQVYGGSTYEKPESPGGGGIKFHSSVRISVNRTAVETVTLPNGTVKTTGIRTNLNTVKNKLTLPNMNLEIVIDGELGINKFETTLNYLVLGKHIRVAGGWKFINIPVKNGYVDKEKKNEKGEFIIHPPVMEEVSYQNSNQLKSVMEVKYPQIKRYMDFLCYQFASTYSPLLKVKIIDKLWGYELEFFGRKVTELTEKEKSAALLLHKINQQEDNK